jgi:hypothetical protein
MRPQLIFGPPHLEGLTDKRKEKMVENSGMGTDYMQLVYMILSKP